MRRWWPGAVALVVLLLVWRFWPVDADEPVPRTTQAARQRARPDPPREPKGAVRHGDLGEPGFLAETPEEEALAAVADASGMGIVECPLPEGAPDAVASSLTRTVQHEATVVGLVAEPSGLTAVYAPVPSVELLRVDADAWMAALERSRVSLGVWRWGDAFPGEEGWCVLDPPTRVTLSGVVRPADPAKPPDEVWLNGCANSSTYVDREFRFEMTVDRGAPCKLEDGSSGFEGTWVDRSDDRSGIVVTQPATSPSMAEHLRVLADEADRELTTPSPVDVALDGEVSDEARRVLEGWSAAERQKARELRDWLREAAGRHEALEEDGAPR